MFNLISLSFMLFFFGCPTPQSPDQGSNTCPQQWNLRVLTTGLPGKSPVLTLEELYYYDNLDALIIFRFFKNFQTYGVKKNFFLMSLQLFIRKNFKHTENSGLCDCETNLPQVYPKPSSPGTFHSSGTVLQRPFNFWAIQYKYNIGQIWYETYSNMWKNFIFSEFSFF